MLDFFQRLQDSDFGVWVSSAPTIWAYPTILMLHTVGLAMVVGPNAVLDLRLLGAGARIPLDALRGVFRVMLIGFIINASTGLALFISEAADKGDGWIFWVKLSIIFVALGVALRIRRLVFRSGQAPPSTISVGLKTLAATSLTLWMGAITAGRLMAYIR